MLSTISSNEANRAKRPTELLNTHRDWVEADCGVHAEEKQQEEQEGRVRPEQPSDHAR